MKNAFEEKTPPLCLNELKRRFAGFVVAFLLFFVILMHTSTNLLAQTDTLITQKKSANDLPFIAANKSCIDIACNHDAILYGEQKESYLGNLYYFEDNKLYVESNGTKTVIVEGDGSNINIVSGKLYFSSFDDNQATIKSVDLNTLTISTALEVGKQKIRNFYIVNEENMLFLSGGAVYSCRLEEQIIKRISSFDNVFSFIPTDSGILYAVGELFDLSIYLDSIHLLDKVTYYSIDIEKDYFIATVDGILFQLPMAKLRGFRDNVKKEGSEAKADLLPYMIDYDLYGTFNAVDLLCLNNENHSCEYCESNYVEAKEERLDEFELNSIETRSIVPLSNVGKMIMSQSNSLTQYSWKPKSNVRRYNSTAYFLNTEFVTGIPYSRPGKFAGTPCEGYMKYIVYGSGDTLESTTGTIVGMSFDSFKTKISNPNSMFYGTAANIAPLYGTDCSGFVAYCWGVQHKLGTSHFSDGLDGVYYCTALNVSGVSSLSILQVGDALVKTGNDGHVVFISQLTVDSNGNLTSLRITEETPPLTRSQSYTPSTLYSTYFSNGYSAYRPNSYKITFKGNGGMPSIPSIYVIANVPYSAGDGLPTATRSGFVFTGWYTAATGGTLVTNASCSSMSARTLYAHWQSGSVQMPDHCILPDARHRIADFYK